MDCALPTFVCTLLASATQLSGFPTPVRAPFHPQAWHDHSGDDRGHKRCEHCRCACCLPPPSALATGHLSTALHLPQSQVVRTHKPTLSISTRNSAVLPKGALSLSANQDAPQTLAADGDDDHPVGRWWDQDALRKGDIFGNHFPCLVSFSSAHRCIAAHPTSLFRHGSRREP